MNDPKVSPQTEADIARMIDRQNDWVEEFRIKEVPIICEGSGIEEEEQI